MAYMTKEELAKMVKEGAVELAPDGQPFTLFGGRTTKFYVDCRKINLTPSGLIAVVNALWKEMLPLKFDAFGGPSLGADPIIGGLTYLAGMCGPRGNKMRGFLVRKEGKEYGKGGRIVGPLVPGSRCVMIEDVVTEGASALSAIAAVEEFGAKVVHAFCIVDRLAGASERFAAKGIPFTSLLTIKDLGLGD